MNQEKTQTSESLLNISLLAMRLIVGAIFFTHGAQKVFGSFGGPGLETTVENFENMGFPAAVGYLVSIGECFGGLGIIVGFLARFSAASNIVIMIGAIVKVHGQKGFLLSDGGFEYNLALIGLLLPILLLGPGRHSIGRFLPLPKRKESDRPILVLE